jgi:ribonuclease BN (tRNA processing enzyme)
LITHQHADHTFGLPFVLAARTIYAPTAGPFTVVGPVGFSAYIDNLLHLAWGDVLHAIVMTRLAPKFIEVSPGETFELAGFRARAELMVHVPDMPCYGYVLEKDGVHFGFSGDTGPCEGLDRLAASSDYFLMEMTGVDDGDRSHLSRRAALDVIARNPGVKFFLTHLNSREPVPGATLAGDLETVELTPPR